MRTETTTRELYTFDELSDEAKEKARENLRRIELESGDIFWSEGVIEDAATIADILGIELTTRTVKLMNGSTRQEPMIYWNLGYSQGDGGGWSGAYCHSEISLVAISLGIDAGVIRSYSGPSTCSRGAGGKRKER